MKAMDTVKLARAQDRLTSRSYIDELFTDFIELHGDRRFGDDKAIIGGIARLFGKPVTVIALEKGTDIDDRIDRNFGSAHPEGYRKALRLMRQAEKFSRPVVCLVDTSGAFCGIGAEERGQGNAISECLTGMMGLKTPIITVLIGQGGSGGALALAVADEVWMLENTIYSVISPEGGASILWKDASRGDEMAAALKLTARDMLQMQVIEKIIPEDTSDTRVQMNSLRQNLEEALGRLENADTDELLASRYARFRKFGMFYSEDNG